MGKSFFTLTHKSMVKIPGLPEHRNLGTEKDVPSCYKCCTYCPAFHPSCVTWKKCPEDLESVMVSLGVSE